MRIETREVRIVPDVLLGRALIPVSAAIESVTRASQG